MIRVYSTIALVFLLLSGGLYYSLSQLFTARAELQATQVSLHKVIDDAAALVARVEGIQVQVLQVSAKTSKTQREVNHVIAQAPEWASTDTPQPVVDELCKFLNCPEPKARSVYTP